MRRLAIAVAIIASVLILPRIGHRQIIGSHEAVYPVVARDMLARGVWLDAELRGEPYRYKPPLYPWAIALASWPGGRVTLTSARLPGALAAIGAVVATFVLGARLFGRRAGLWSALVLVTSILFFDHALVTIPDVPMVFIGLLAGLALWSIGNGGGAGAAFAFWIAVGLGVFVKHFSGLLPVAVALVWLPGVGGRSALKRLVSWPGIAVFVLLTASWLVPFARGGGGAGKFTTEIVWGDWLRQHIGGPRLATLGGELGIALLGFLPWTLLLPVALVAAVRARRERAVAFALWWLVVPALFIFWVQQQRARYLLPLVAGAALIVGWWADREASEPRRRPVLAVASLVLAVVGTLGTPYALRAAGIALPSPPWAIALVLAGVAAIGTVAAAGFWTARLATAFPAVAALSAVLLLGGGWIVDEWQNRTWDFPAVARDLDRRPGALAVVGLATDNQELLPLDFYIGRSLPLLRSPAAVRAHLQDRHGIVAVEDWRWRSADQWLPLAADTLRADPVGAGVVVVGDGR